jgi:sigma-B regulation protein RsbU (phosphoserine phosphatase)
MYSGRRCLDAPVGLCLGAKLAREYARAGVRDISERRRLENDLRKAKEVAEHAYDLLHRDLEAAALLQRALLPAALPVVPGLQFAWEYHACAGLAGDGLNLFWLDDGHVGLYVLDVSGHGIQAALLSVTLARLLSPTSSQSSFLRVRLPDESGYQIVPPAEMARRLNQWFFANKPGDQFFTMFYGVLDVRLRLLRFVSAGSPAFLHLRAVARRELLTVPGFPIGLTANADYVEHSLQLEPGDRLFLYSDGMIDAVGPACEPFGQERLQQLITAAGPSEPLKACTQRLLDGVLQWTRNTPQDDLSVLALAVQ